MLGWGFRASAFLISLACVFGTGTTTRSDTSDSAFTSYQKVAESLYPVSQMIKSHRKPTPSEKEWFDRAMSTTLQQIEAIDSLWYTRIAAPYSSQDFSDTLRYLRESPVWICLDQCVCPEKSPLGCAQGKFYGEALGTVITLNACLFEEEKKCKYGSGRNKNELLFEALAKSAAQIAFYKSNLKKTGYEKKMVTSYEVLIESVRGLNAIQSRCQKAPEASFSSEAFSTLKKTGHLRELGSIHDRCAQKLVSLFRVPAMPKPCAYALDRKRWDAHWRYGLLKESSVKALRCEGVCERVTCGPVSGDASPVSSPSRALGFADHWYLSVPEGLCEGEEPADSRDFIRKTIERYLNAETLAATLERREALVSQCQAGFLNRL